MYTIYLMMMIVAFAIIVVCMSVMNSTGKRRSGGQHKTDIGKENKHLMKSPMKRTTAKGKWMRRASISIVYIVLTGLLVGAALGILLAPDMESIVFGKMIGASIIGVFIGVSIGVIFCVQSFPLPLKEEVPAKSILHFKVVQKAEKATGTPHPPLL